MEFNPYDYKTDKNPYPIYDHLRENSPLYYSKEFDFYALFRYDDIFAAYLDFENYSSTGGATIEDVPIQPMMIMQDPPEHMMTRGIVREYFTPKAIEAMEPIVRKIVCTHLDRLMGQDVVDAVGEFSSLFPMDVISSILGIPEQDHDEIREASNRGLFRNPGEPMPPPDSIDALIKSRGMYMGYLQDRRTNPQDDLMTVLVNAEVEEPSTGIKRGLTDEELLGFCGLLAAAGNETLTKFFGNAINLLAMPEYADARRQITSDSDCIPNAMEEILRFDPPSQYTVRIAMNDIKVAGGVIPKGKKVALVIASANRDPSEFDQPNTMDIHRKIKKHLALGFGRHQCLGAALVRMEGKIALQEWHKRFPNYKVIPDKVAWVHSSNVRGFSNLPVRILK